jgi:alkanesulfonate monooxygenase SsuD/methylene tetrahydromethanopterin reductase-like flavin-dependent oxidoreductase (luciferase family)
MHFYLKYDLRAPDFGPPPEELYQACIEQCVWAERHGFAGVRLHEHHASEDGYLPAPIVMGGAIAGATSKLALRFSVIVLPLHDPGRSTRLASSTRWGSARRTSGAAARGLSSG